MIVKKLEGIVFKHKDHLWHEIKATAMSIPPEKIFALYDSMPDPMSAVRLARGGNTRY